MQVLLLGLFVAIFLHDATTAVEVVRGGSIVRVTEAMPGDVWPALSPVAVLAIVLLPKLLIVLAYWLACRGTRKRLGTERGQRALNRLETITEALPFVLLGLFIFDLSAGSLRHLRTVFQEVVLIDEFLVMLPTLLVAVASWSAYYPVDRRLREALIMRDADAGRPVYPLLSRGEYVLMQLRHQFGLLLLPLLAVFAWSEAILLMGPDSGGPLSAQAVSVLSPVGVLVVFVLAPLVIRHTWQTSALPPGEVRDRMVALCKQHQVRVRELLLWRTSGRMVNAAVAGLVWQVRYILLSDGLLDQLGPRAVEAVMAHELAHVKCRHLIWMSLFIVATLGLFESAGYAALDAYARSVQAEVSGEVSEGLSMSLNDPNLRMTIISIPAFAVALVGFGWFSRRIERQADVFAARHLALTSDEKAYDPLGKQVFDRAAVQTMVHALQRVAALNHAPTTRKSWRHGSIAWRQEHLRSLIDQPLDDTPVDRLLRRLKPAILAGVVVLAMLYLV